LACNLDGGIDLHVHTSASDGSHTPNEIVALAQQLRLEALSITDHDTINGVKEILATSFPKTIKFVPGIEISVDAPKAYRLDGSLHLLGYGIDPDNSGLNKLLVLLRKSRDNRVPRIVHKLYQLGIHISITEIKKQAPKSILGRPHIAKALVSNGYASSVDDAFNRFLGKGKPAYVDKFRITCQTAIEAIKIAGGLTVLAHPFLIDHNFEKIENLVDLMIPLGLAGIECIYPEHSHFAISFYKSLAKRKGLLITGGTDFHGSDVRPGICLGSGRGDMHIPYKLYQRMQARLANV
jgi:3',5'-nucleoside bisphosphate phosphatase